jgi:hypothetical protein
MRTFGTFDTRAFNADQDADLLRQYEAGVSLSALATQTGRSKSSVGRAVTRARQARDEADRAARAAKREAQLARKRRPAVRERQRLSPARPELASSKSQPKEPAPDPPAEPARLVRPKSATVQRGRKQTFEEYVEMRLDENARRRGEQVPDRAARKGTFRRPQVSVIGWGPDRRGLG